MDGGFRGLWRAHLKALNLLRTSFMVAPKLSPELPAASFAEVTPWCVWSE